MTEDPQGLKRVVFYKRYPRDLIEKTAGMPFEDKVVYSFLLDLIYFHAGHLQDEPRYIAGQLNCSVRKWNTIRSNLIAAGKVQIISGFITNYRAIIELKKLGLHSDNQAEKAKSRWEKSREKEAECNENNGLQYAMALPENMPPVMPEAMQNGCHTETDTEADTDKEEEEGASARISLSVFEEVMLAVGVDPAKPPKFWRGAPATTHVLGWQLVHSLTDDEVIEACRLSRADHPEPPDGPKALDRYIAGYAKAKASAGAIKANGSAKREYGTPVPSSHAPTDRDAVMRFWADSLNAGRFVSTSSIKPDLARAMIEAQLVTPETLKSKGIAF